MQEEWRDILGHEGHHQVSSAGRVRSFVLGKEGFLTQRKTKGGYVYVTMHGVRSYVHRLVALAFLMNGEGKRTVNHKNGDKSDNDLNNLEWATHAENNLHAYRTGLRNSFHRRKRVKGVHLITQEVLLFASVRSVDAMGFDHSTVSQCALGKERQHKGYVWSFA